MRIVIESRVERTPRVVQARGMFDLADESVARNVWNVHAPLDERAWNIGLICGPSGSGKSTIAKGLLGPGPATLWQESLPDWPARQSVLDGFPDGQSMKEITALLGAVGFASPPAWLRPYLALSTGQQFRCDLARLLANLLPGTVGVMDEFTSVVDRTVARIGCAALAKAVRGSGKMFVAVSCHEDVVDWLQPDWILRADTGTFAWRELQRRPPVSIDLVRTTASAWPLFRAHHYLSHALNMSAVCFLGLIQLDADARTGSGEEGSGQPAVFSAWVNRLSAGGGRREHRTVVLPDYQGIGVGMAVSTFLASMWKGLGQRATSTTTHPAFIAARKRHPDWRMVRKPSLTMSERGRNKRIDHATTRLTAGFEYVGPAMSTERALRLLSV